MNKFTFLDKESFNKDVVYGYSLEKEISKKDIKTNYDFIKRNEKVFRIHQNSKTNNLYTSENEEVEFNISIVERLLEEFYKEEAIYEEKLIGKKGKLNKRLLNKKNNIDHLMDFVYKIPESCGGILVYIDNNEVLGFCLYSNCIKNKRNYTTLSITTIYVRKDQRGKGIASTLIQKCTSLGVKYKFKKLRLGVLGNNIPAHNLYNKNGFKETEIIYYDKIKDITFTEQYKEV